MDTFLEMQEARSQSMTAAAAEAPAPQIDQYLHDYVLGPADVVSLSLTGIDAPTATMEIRARVDDTGQIDLPLAGKVEVGGMSESEAEHSIKSAFVPGVVKQLTVHLEVLSFDTTDVVVSGAVTAPGLVSLRRTERNALYAMLAAGGVSDLASGKVTIRRARRSGPDVVYDLTDTLQFEAALAEEPLQDGDRVIAEAAPPNTVYVGGLLNNPRPQAYPTGVKVTLLQAIAAAGGLREDVLPREGTLIRRLPDVTDVHVKLNLRRVQSGEDPNITMAAGDILWVPETLETRFIDFLNRNIFIRAGVSVNYNVTGLEYLNRKSLQMRRFGGAGGNLADSFDPLGFLSRNAALNQIVGSPGLNP